MGVMVFGSHGVWELQCVGVAMCGSCSVRELWCVRVAACVETVLCGVHQYFSMLIVPLAWLPNAQVIALSTKNQLFYNFTVTS